MVLCNGVWQKPTMLVFRQVYNICLTKNSLKAVTTDIKMAHLKKSTSDKCGFTESFIQCKTITKFTSWGLLGIIVKGTPHSKVAGFLDL